MNWLSFREGLLKKPSRFLFKFGSQVVRSQRDKGLSDALKAHISSMAELVEQGHEVICVSSGAVSFGRQFLNFEDASALSTAELQMCASVGQAALIQCYREEFARKNIEVAQLLVTGADFSSRERFLNLSRLIEVLLKKGIVPIVNENDSTSTFELEQLNYRKKSFGDNDFLASQLAIKMHADLLLLFMSADGIYEQKKDSYLWDLLPQIDDIVDYRAEVNQSMKNTIGRGGLESKIEAARIAAVSGVSVFIANGLKPEIIASLMKSKELEKGTFIPALSMGLSSKKKWIAHSSGFEGAIIINDCAVDVLVHKGASLLAIGITKVEGNFRKGDVVSVQCESGTEIARGLVNFDAHEVNARKGKTTEVVEGVSTEIIHRNEMVVFKALRKKKDKSE